MVGGKRRSVTYNADREDEDGKRYVSHVSEPPLKLLKTSYKITGFKSSNMGLSNLSERKTYTYRHKSTNSLHHGLMFLVHYGLLMLQFKSLSEK